MILFILFASALAYELPNNCLQENYNSKATFNACNYIFKKPINTKDEGDVFNTGNELYQRDKCTTCCRVLFVSEYNHNTGAVFTDEDDKDEENNKRYTMDLEFDDVKNVRAYTTSWEQCILARGLTPGKSNQYWEFAPYMMYISFNIPKRVHDIRSGAGANNRLIIWKKKPPLETDTKNQRFIYIHPYNPSYYPEDKAGKHVYTRGKPYQKHFFLPFATSVTLCYEIGKTQSASAFKGTGTWSGNSGYSYTESDAYQITAQTCSNTEPAQMWIPVFA